MYLLILERLWLEALLDVFYFPLWWYSQGALGALRACLRLLARGNERLAPGLWLRNIFVPMFGQHDFTGRLISFFMRVAQIIARSFALLVWAVACLTLWLLWLLFPIFVLWQLYRAFVFLK